ncbi:NADH:ubiquinone oxidoreductase subunit M [endosymbiont of Acanthamoeba sp. UWC8]|uniref:NADH-quinone oxidoreductase subunit M n=1 Tax=endosymbiont of Acanthamoeba sp. UWC8 TaxID=86106 RepID=UPI0004D12469|nr:NADH-quinone oxidoreductase subunit M [endosymbiont of Acanthamoeba sp. UWC8]AIF81152.1 NADH:ubiquinone oxidoreductase subunit M [endosymbiont of Acanthamoeba sp. UWC8]
MNSFPILTVLILLPLIGAALIFITNNEKKSLLLIKSLALITTLIEFIVSLYVWGLYDPNNASLQFVEKKAWIDGYNVHYSLGIDGISIFFVLLTTFLLPICILAGWNSIKKRVKEYMINFLVLEALVIGTFCAADILLFFIFFEAVLIPMFLIIGVWGGEKKVYAAFKFFLYTFFGSVFLLISFIFIYYHTDTTDIFELYDILPTYTLEVQKWLWLGMFISFAVKVPMWPVHTWLPDAHVQAPTSGSVILAGVLLKLGGYGFLRFSLPMLPEASHYFADMVIILSIIAVIYTSLVALMQEDMKKLIAYSSVAHMGFVTAGIFAFTQQGIEGAVFQMVSHGLVSGALFLCVGVVYDRMHTKEIAFYSGLTSLMPKFALVFMVFMLASVALPGTSGFVGEFLVLLGVFEANKIYGALVATGMVLGAAYMLWLYARIMFGEVKNEKLALISDLDKREVAAFLPLLFLVIILGIYPKVITKNITSSVEVLKDIVDQSAINDINDTNY